MFFVFVFFEPFLFGMSENKSSHETLISGSNLMSVKNVIFNPLSANPTKWSSTLKQFVGC